MLLFKSNISKIRIRTGNIFRNREPIISFIRNKDDIWFFKSYRLPRMLFYDLLDLIPCGLYGQGDESNCAFLTATCVGINLEEVNNNN